MSPHHTTVSNPQPGKRVPLGTLLYFRDRNRQRLWEMIVDEFERSGITQAELALRMGRDPGRVCTFLGAPGNYEIDTVSDYLFAMSGAQPEYSVSHPLSNSPKEKSVTPTPSAGASSSIILPKVELKVA